MEQRPTGLHQAFNRRPWWQIIVLAIGAGLAVGVILSHFF
jgi:hypothetical protein